ncbi:hypothetical protein BGZ74_001934, partial [Mortierella antarctica]
MDSSLGSYGERTPAQYLYQPGPLSHLHPQPQSHTQPMNTSVNTMPYNAYQTQNTWAPGSLPTNPGTRGETQEHMVARHFSYQQQYHHMPQQMPQMPQQQTPMYQSLRYPGGGDMPQTYYFQANSAVFEQGVPRQRVCSHDSGVPYMTGNVYQGQNTNYTSSYSRRPPYGPPSVSQPLLALPPPLSAPTISHKPEEMDDAVVPPARAHSIPPNTAPYPPDSQSRAQARANNRRATT